MIEENRGGTSSAALPRYQRGRVRTEDQLDLVLQSWVPQSPRGVIVIIHGLAEHGGRYQETAAALGAGGWAVYAGDLRGHGLSPDVPGAGRVHVKRFTDYFRDVDAFVAEARKNHQGLPLFILGHSMGGLISISYVLERPQGISGAVISSPALGIHPDSRPPAWLKMMVGVLSAIAPRLKVASDLDTNLISRDPAVVQAYVDDPLVSEKVSVRWYREFTKAIARANRAAATLKVPMLLMQSGDDRLVDPTVPPAWAAAAPDGLVEQVTWDGLYHEMFNEPEKDTVRQRVLAWLAGKA
jgi:alpha-beta hydrolase superfamily lysophospholipase